MFPGRLVERGVYRDVGQDARECRQNVLRFAQINPDKKIEPEKFERREGKQSKRNYKMLLHFALIFVKLFYLSFFSLIG